MNKLKKSSKNLPIVIISIDVEELRYKSEDEVISISDKLNKNLRIARSKKDSNSSKLLEKEICYVQRELENRRKRRTVHNRFISKK